MRVRAPRYLEIAERIREQIRSGALRPGDRIPSERELMTSYGVSVTVARAAIGQLRAEGIVESRQGKGSFVREHRELIRIAAGRYRRTGIAPGLQEDARGGWTTRVTADIQYVEASDEVAERLGIEPAEMVSQATYLWRVEDELVQISTQWEPLRITGGTLIERPAGSTPGEPDVITRFDSIGLAVTQVPEYIRTRMPTPDEGARMDIPEGVPIFVITRTHFAGETAVETAEILMRGDRFVIENINEVLPANAPAAGVES